MVCRSMLASDIGEMDRARFRLSLGVSLGLGNRDTVEEKWCEFSILFPPFFSFMGLYAGEGEGVCFTTFIMCIALTLLH